MKFRRLLIGWKNNRVNQSSGVGCLNTLRFVDKKTRLHRRISTHLGTSKNGIYGGSGWHSSILRKYGKKESEKIRSLSLVTGDRGYSDENGVDQIINRNQLDPINMQGIKQKEVISLSIKTEKILKHLKETRSISTYERTNEMLQLTYQWRNILKSLNEVKDLTISIKPKRYIQTPEKYTMTLKVTCAEQICSILDEYVNIISSPLLMKEVMSLSSHAPTLPFGIAIDAWRDSSCHSAGYSALSVLNKWNDLYGGDIDHWPTIQAYNSVLSAYAHSSSGNYKVLQNQKRNNDGYLPAEKSWDLFNFLTRSGSMFLKADMETCSHTINALTNHALILKHSSRKIESTLDSQTAASRAFSIFKLMTENCPQIDKALSENFEHKAFVVRAYADIISLSCHMLIDHGEDDLVGSRTEDLLLKMKEYVKSTLISSANKEINARIGLYIEDAYLSTIVAWGEQRNAAQEIGNISALCSYARSADSLLSDMEKLDHSITAIKINLRPEHFHAVIDSYANCLDGVRISTEEDKLLLVKFAPQNRCQLLLDQVENQWTAIENNNEIAKVNASMYSRVIWSWLRYGELCIHTSDALQAARKGELIFQKMLRLLETNHLLITNSKVLTLAANDVLMAYAQIEKNREVYEKSRRLFNFIKRGLSNNQKMQNVSLQPDSSTFFSYLTMLSRSGRVKAGNEAYSLLLDMKSNGENTTSENIKPDLSHYSLVIKSLSSGRHAGDVRKAHDLLEHIVEEYSLMSHVEREQLGIIPSILFSTVITAWARSQDDGRAQEALNLLSRLENYHLETMDENFKPDIIAYGSVLDALSKVRKDRSKALVTSERILDTLEKKYESGEKDLLPNKLCYTAVISGWSRSGKSESGEKAQEIFLRMENMFKKSDNENVRPDNIAYCSLLSSWSRSRRPDSVKHAEAILQAMEEKADKGEYLLKPTVYAYTGVINTLWKSGKNNAGEKAEEILERMEKKFTEGDLQAKPDAWVYTAVINTWGRNNSPQKVTRAWSIFCRMKEKFDNGDKSCAPDVISITAMINVCAYNTATNHKSRTESVKIALECLELILKQPENFGPVNSILFRTLLECVGKNMTANPSMLEKISANVFHRCCEAGEVDASVLNTLKRYTPTLYDKLPLAKRKLSLKHLPPKWTRNKEDMTKEYLHK